jgi:hypothetical protein
MRFIREKPMISASSGQRRPCPARDNRHAFQMAVAHQGCRLSRGFRQSNRQRQTSIGGEAIGFEWHQTARFGDQCILGNEFGKISNDRRPRRNHPRHWLQKLNRFHFRPPFYPICTERPAFGQTGLVSSI